MPEESDKLEKSQPKLEKHLELYTFFGLATLGLFLRIFIVPSNNITGKEGPATNTIWGYGLSIISLLCLFLLIYGLYDKGYIESINFKSSTSNKGENFIAFLLENGILFILAIIVLVLIVTLNYAYFKRINIGIIPVLFNRLDNLSNIIMLLTLLLLFQYVYNQIFNSDDKNNKNEIYKAVSYLLNTVNIILIIIMYIVIEFFSTDG